MNTLDNVVCGDDEPILCEKFMENMVHRSHNIETDQRLDKPNLKISFKREEKVREN